MTEQMPGGGSFAKRGLANEPTLANEPATAGRTCRSSCC